MNQKVKNFCIIAIIGAMYCAVSLALAPLSFGNIQIRIAECLTMLPLIYAPSVYGVILGCFLTNFIGAFIGVNVLGFMDVFVGTLATALAAILTYKLRNYKVKDIPVLAILMPVIFNGVIIGAELGYVLFPNAVLMGSIISGIEVAVGELVSVIVGYILVRSLARKTKIFD